MLSNKEQTEFKSEFHKQIWELGCKIIPFEESTIDITDDELLHGLRQVYDFTVELVTDMFNNLEEYQDYVPESHPNGQMSAWHWAARLGRAATLLMYLQSLCGQADDNGVIVKSKDPQLEQLDAVLAKRGFLSFESENKDDGTIIIKCNKYPLLMQYLTAFISRMYSVKKRLQGYCQSMIMACDFNIFGAKNRTKEETEKLANAKPKPKAPKVTAEGRIELYQDRLRAYKEGVCEIPETFTVAEEYLRGLTEGEFCTAFKDLKEMVMQMYEDLIEDPEKLITKKDGVASAKVDSIFKLLFVSGYTGELDGDALAAEKSAFMDAYICFYKKGMSGIALSDKKTFTVPKATQETQDKFYEKEDLKALFLYFQSYGFKIEEQDGKIFVAYPKNPVIMKAIKAFAKHKVFFYTYLYDYKKFNYRIFATPSDKRAPLESLYTFHMLNDEMKEYFSLLNKKMGEMKAGYGDTAESDGDGNVKYVYNRSGYLGLHVAQNVKTGVLRPNLVFTRSVRSYSTVEFFASIPGEIDVKYGKCACKSDPVLECGYCYNLTVRGEEIYMCTGKRWWFPTTMEAMPYLLTAFEKMADKKSDEFKPL